MLPKDSSNPISGTLNERKPNIAGPLIRIFIFNQGTSFSFKKSFKSLLLTITIRTKNIKKMGLFSLKVRLIRDSQCPSG